ncbi:uncharacterized protein L201_006816 [Kwoniella dendrophila CBS 6074]|uniref:Rad21/Rec8-like protein N-terminal domain-containing protein n=1 Tax=Kwoniella dendrophila CBS 6074 TaxID=1295534 RepID=A0AAX4K430_9TREE
MFYSEELLTNKNGTFGIIWLAATLGPKNKKISKKQLTSIDLAKTCDLIAEPPEPMALRLSGALLMGVTRVYTQNYEIFYSDVTNFHSNLRRSIATDFATTSTNTGGTTTLDLPGGGRSRLDQITFADTGLDLEMGLNWHFHHIDWNNPLSVGRKRRSSSVLSSQATKQSDEDSDEEDDVEADEEDDQSEMGRNAKRKKVSSSPAVGIITRTRNSIHHPSEPTGGALYAGIDMQVGEIDLELGLDMDGGEGNDSFSSPSGRGFEFPTDEADTGMILEGGDLAMPSRQPSVAPEGEVAPPGLDLDKEGRHRSRSKERVASENGSIEVVEQQLEATKKKKKAKKVKKAFLDPSIELTPAEEQRASKKYLNDMGRERKAITSKAQEKAIATKATHLVDGLGGLDFLNPAMNDFFSTFTRVDKFKWESELAVNRDELNRMSHDQLEGQGHEADPPALAGEGRGEFPDTTTDVYQEFEVPIQEMSNSVRQGSIGVDPEYARRASQASQQALPWEDRSRSGTPGFPDIGDTSVSPNSLRLSLMTPQEAKLRSRSIPGSSAGPASRGPARHRSSSLMSDIPDNDPLLLVQGDDIELPEYENEFQLESLPPSQKTRLADLPAAFRPETLATLEKQCRDFFSYIERKMLNSSLDEIDFEDLAPEESTKHVASLAFYDCLTLATKKILTVNQEEPWGTIKVKFAVGSF